MKTIEKRAKEYCHREKVENIDCLHAYTIGATEQKAIDEKSQIEEMHKLNEEWKENLRIQREILIDKACEWITKEWAIHDCDVFTAVSRIRKALEQ